MNQQVAADVRTVVQQTMAQKDAEQRVATEKAAFQESLIQTITDFPQSSLKLISSPILNTDKVVIGNGSNPLITANTPSTVWIPTKDHLRWREALDGGNGAGVAFPAVAQNIGGQPNVYPQYYKNATYLSEFSSVTMSHTNTVDQFIVNLPSADRYSKQTSSLFNNANDRNISQRINFKADPSVSYIAKNQTSTPVFLGASTDSLYYPMQDGISIKQDTAIGQINTKIKFTSGNENRFDAFLNDRGSLPQYSNTANTYEVDTMDNLLMPSVTDGQQQYIPMGFYYYVKNATATNASTLMYQPYTFNYCVRLGDAYHDTFLNSYKHYYSSSVFQREFQTNTIDKILMKLPFQFTERKDGTGNFTGNFESVKKAGGLSSYNGSDVTIVMDKIRIKYYAETNQKIREAVMMMDFAIVCPYVSSGVSQYSAGGNQECSVTGVVPKGGRLYRVYNTLFGKNSLVGRPLHENTSNIGCDILDDRKYYNKDATQSIQGSKYGGKWSGKNTMRINDEEYATIYGDEGDWYSTYERFSDGSVKTKSEIEYNGSVIHHFDSSEKNGTKWEYTDNTMRGMLMPLSDINISSTFDTVQTDFGDNPNATYDNQLTYVYLKKGYVRKGEFSWV